MTLLVTIIAFIVLITMSVLSPVAWIIPPPTSSAIITFKRIVGRHIVLVGHTTRTGSCLGWFFLNQTRDCWHHFLHILLYPWESSVHIEFGTSLIINYWWVGWLLWKRLICLHPRFPNGTNRLSSVLTPSYHVQSCSHGLMFWYTGLCSCHCIIATLTKFYNGLFSHQWSLYLHYFRPLCLGLLFVLRTCLELNLWGFWQFLNTESLVHFGYDVSETRCLLFSRSRV